MKTRTTTWAAQIAVVLVLMASGMASGATGFLSWNSPLGKNVAEAGYCPATTSLSGGTHQGCGEGSLQDAAGLFVAPITTGAGEYVSNPMLEHLGRGYGQAAEQTFRPWLKAGVNFEAEQLVQLGLEKNTTVWRPTIEQTQSAAFKVIVGKPKYTSGGLLRGSILEATEPGFLEIKSGRSVLNSTYQLRLQTYRSLVEDTPYTIRTTRPVNPQFRSWLERWGVTIENP